jgi:hypothetical protein
MIKAELELFMQKEIKAYQGSWMWGASLPL